MTTKSKIILLKVPHVRLKEESERVFLKDIIIRIGFILRHWSRGM